MTIAALLGARDRPLSVRRDVRTALVGAARAPVPGECDRAVLRRGRGLLRRPAADGGRRRSWPSATRAVSAARHSPSATRRGRRWSTRSRTRPRWANGRASHAICTTSSPTTCRRSQFRPRAPACTIEGLPEEGRAHFEAIGQTARDALTEMRRLLGVLREDANAEAARDPQPSLARLNELVETARAAGTPVTLTLEGKVAPLPPGRRPLRVPHPAGGTHERSPARTGCCRRGRARVRAATRCACASATTGLASPRRISTGTASWECASGRSWSVAR